MKNIKQGRRMWWGCQSRCGGQVTAILNGVVNSMNGVVNSMNTKGWDKEGWDKLGDWG